MTLKIGQVLDRRYRIDQLLGQGGFGAVYQAWDLSLDRTCAVKENLDTSDMARRQFTREATVLAGLSHTNLPRVTDHFTIAGYGQYLVMDFVDGIDLGQLIRTEGPIPTERALNIIKQVADALGYLHSRKPPVLHRDIKPGNIKITPEGRAVLVDFGLVKMYAPQFETTVGARAVTPGYSPPEQYGQGITDPRSDIYALAATLYTLLTGRLPPESVQRYSTDDLVLPHQVDATIPATVSAAVGRAMALSPSQRFQSISDMRAVLWPDVTLRPAAPPSHSRAWLWVLGGALGLLACLALGGVATVGGALALPFLFGSPTPTASATATDAPTPATFLYQDNFADTHGGWLVGVDAGGQRLFDSGQYVIQVTKKNWVTWSPGGTDGLRDLHAEVTITSTGYAADEGFGLICNYTDATHFYFLGFTPDGYFAIAKRNGDTDAILSDPNGKWIQSMRIAAKAGSYRLGVDCGADGTLVLYAGGLQVAVAQDSTFTSGQVGLFVRSFEQIPVEVRFGDLAVTALH